MIEQGHALSQSSPPHPGPGPVGEGERWRAWSTIKTIIKWLLFIIVLWFVAVSLGKQFKQVDWTTVHFKPLPILLAAGCLLLVPPVQLISYRTLLGAYAHAPPLRVMAAVAWIPPLGKYVPGKVASLVGAVYILRKFQIPTAIALSVVLVMDGLAVVSGLITGSPLLRTVMPAGWIPAAIVTVIGIVCLHPAVFGRLLNFVLVKTKRQPLDHMPDLKHYLIPVICAFSQWVLAGLALWLIARSVAFVSAGEIPRFVSIAGLGYTISYLALFAPGGLGPREYIFQKTMQPIVIPAAMSAVAVVVMRIVQTLTELTAAMVGLIVLRHIERGMEKVDR
jgi:glycosyltransferase 2 family protein